MPKEFATADVSAFLITYLSNCMVKENNNMDSLSNSVGKGNNNIHGHYLY